MTVESTSPSDPFALLSARLSGRSDDARLALVLEGGGMRGVVSAAMAGALEDLGATRHIDLFVGTSAGATNAVAAACGQANAMSHTYGDVFVGREFADTRRLLRGRPPVNGGLVVDTAIQLLGLEDRVADLDATVAAVATRVDDAVSVPLTDLADPADLAAALKASGTLPLVGGPPVVYGGTRWLDGGVAEAIPIRAAKALGATHAIVLATRPDGDAPSYTLMDQLVERYLQRLSVPLADAYRARSERYLAERAALATGEVDGIRTVVLAPGAEDPIPGRTDRDATVLHAAREAAYERAAAVLATAVVPAPEESPATTRSRWAWRLSRPALRRPSAPRRAIAG